LVLLVGVSARDRHPLPIGHNMFRNLKQQAKVRHRAVEKKKKKKK
jgi:hypothetical protein